jgi:hypothetical protein
MNVRFRKYEGEGVFLPKQRHYHRLILLLNTTYTATCYCLTTIFK